MARASTVAALPPCLATMVESFNELLPGVPWNEGVVGAMLWQAAANASSCKFVVPVLGSHGDVEVELEIHSSLCICRHTPGRANVSVYCRSLTPPSGRARGLPQRRACWSCCWRPGGSSSAYSMGHVQHFLRRNDQTTACDLHQRTAASPACLLRSCKHREQDGSA